VLYTKPINEILWDDVETFCQQGVPEGAYLDYKQDFPKHLHKTIAAMANTLGGVILIGVAENAEGKPVVPVHGIVFQKGLHERVMNIILTNIIPPVFPEISVCSNASGDRALIVIRVTQSHQTPHAIAGNTEAYLRTGNRNNPEAIARLDEIAWLRDRRRRSEELREEIYTRADSRFSAFYYRQLNEWMAEGKTVQVITNGWLTLTLCPLYPKEPFCTPPEMNKVYIGIKVVDYMSTDTAFPMPNMFEGKVVQDGIVLNEGFHIDDAFYTEINCFGLLFYKQNMLRKEYGANSSKVMRQSEIFCRLDEFLNCAIKFFNQISYWGLLEFRMHLTQIEGCGLCEYRKDEWLVSPLYSPDPEVRFSDSVLAGALEAEKPRLILQAVQRVAWAFGSNVNQEMLDFYYKKYKKS
jgi:hypothetical protein